MDPPSKVNLSLLKDSDDDYPLRSSLCGFISEKTTNYFGWVSSDDDKQFLGVLTLNDESLKVRQTRGLFIEIRKLNYNYFEENFLYISKQFLKHYNLDLKSNYLLRICQSPPRLERVVFGARTQSVFEWVQNPNWVLEFDKVLQKRSVLCRKGDISFLHVEEMSGSNETILANLITVDCSPSCQGVIDSRTKVIVTRLESISKSNDQHHSILRGNSMDTFSSTNVKNDSMDAYLNIINYTSRLMFQFRNSQSAPVMKSLAVSNAALGMFKSWKFKVQIEAKAFNAGILSEDPHSCIYVGKDLLTRVAKENEWLYVKLSRETVTNDQYELRPRLRRFSSNMEDQSFSFQNERMTHSLSLDSESSLDERKDKDSISETWRMVQIRVSPNALLLEPFSAQISPQLWFNLNSHPSPLIQTETKLIIKKSLTNRSPPFAEEVYLALIQSPSYTIESNFDVVIKKHFSTVRYLCKGDVIALSTRDDINYRYSQENTSEFGWPTVYFNVSRLDGPSLGSWKGYKVDFNHCRLYQLGLEQSYIPVTMSTYLSPSLMHDVWHSPFPPGISKTIEKLCHLILPFLSSKKFREQVPANVLLCGEAHSGKRLVVKSTCRSLNLHLYVVNCQDLVGETAAASEARLRIIAKKALTYAPCILLLKDISFLLKEAQGEDTRTVSSFCTILSSLFRNSDWPVVVVGTSSTLSTVHPDILPVFLHTVQMSNLDENERVSLLDYLLGPIERSGDLSLNRLSQRSQGFLLGDLNLLVDSAAQNAYARLTDQSSKSTTTESEEILCIAGVPIIQNDFTKSLDSLLNSQAQAIGAPKIPNVLWKDVGGLENVKKEILDTVQLPLEHPELLQAGLRRSGLLLYGPPGTGKTLLAKAVATECSLSFLSVKGPELINMYVGQSEENIREVFSRAQRASPCIIFFDELDSLAPNRGHSGDSGGVMDRVVSQLLAELDGLHRATDVFVIGATNRPDLLDPALLRPGRFDRLVYVGLPETAEERSRIIAALTRKMILSEDVDLNQIEQLAPAGLSGADFYALCSEAQTSALARCIADIEAKKVDAKGLSPNLPEVTMEDFRFAATAIVPSSLTSTEVKNN